jgi:transcriptional antiterminator RfaH
MRWSGAIYSGYNIPHLIHTGTQMVTPELTWYALHSHPNKEAFLHSELTARGIEVYYPFLRVKPVNPRSRKVRPYFPGYLFVRLDQTRTRESEIRWMPHAYGLVGFGDEPAGVPDALIERVRKQIDLTHAQADPASFKPGDAVTITGELFRGYEAVFDTAIAGTERVRVLLLLLNNRVPVEVSRTQVIRPAGAKP